MILRIVRGAVPSDRLAALAEEFATRYVQVARTTPGLVRFHAGIRPEADRHALAIVSFWTSVEAALAAFDGDLDTPRALGGEWTVARFSDVAYFEVDESQLRRATGDAAVLRITVGRVAQGADASIQQEVRARLHELPDAMTEAYVGRRIVGNDVEVTFVSAWEQVPPGRALDEPIWPEISARYDTFAVEAYVSISSGPPGN